MRLYLSGPFSNNPTFMDDFADAEARLKRRYPDLIIFNPAKFFEGTNWDYDQIMKRCLEIIKFCDAIVLLKGWAESKGSLMEMDEAAVQDKEIIKFDRFMV